MLKLIDQGLLLTYIPVLCRLAGVGLRGGGKSTPRRGHCPLTIVALPLGIGVLNWILCMWPVYEGRQGARRTAWRWLIQITCQPHTFDFVNGKSG